MSANLRLCNEFATGSSKRGSSVNEFPNGECATADRRTLNNARQLPRWRARASPPISDASVRWTLRRAIDEHAPSVGRSFRSRDRFRQDNTVANFSAETHAQYVTGHETRSGARRLMHVDNLWTKRPCQTKGAQCRHSCGKRAGSRWLVEHTLDNPLPSPGALLCSKMPLKRNE